VTREIEVRTWTTGRILIEDRSSDPVAGLLVGCHGYGQDADAMLDEMRRLPGLERWRLASVQGLHRFYTRNSERVIASWMTRQNREAAIADNIEYMRRAVDAAGGASVPAIAYLGFSQGASMAARAAAHAERPAAALVILGGDIPADVRADSAARLPPVLIGCGSQDTWYSKLVEGDAAFLKSRGIPHELVRFNGGHEFTDEFRAAVGKFLRSTVEA
jgi:predicted esterase